MSEQKRLLGQDLYLFTDAKDERIAELEAALAECLDALDELQDLCSPFVRGRRTEPCTGPVFCAECAARVALRHRALLKKEGGAP